MLSVLVSEDDQRHDAGVDPGVVSDRVGARTTETLDHRPRRVAELRASSQAGGGTEAWCLQSREVDRRLAVHYWDEHR